MTRKGKKATQRAPAKVPYKTQTASKPRRKRSLQDPAQSSMPPPATGKVNRARRSMLVSTSASNTSVGANVSTKKPTPDVAQSQEVCSSSEEDAQPGKKEIVDGMIEINDAAIKEYPKIPAVLNRPLVKKIQEVLSQEVLNRLSVR